MPNKTVLVCFDIQGVKNFSSRVFDTFPSLPANNDLNMVNINKPFVHTLISFVWWLQNVCIDAHSRNSQCCM